MGSEVIIVPALFGIVFGMFYLYISARNKERLALIEKGADASIFFNKAKRLTPFWKVFILNVSLLMIGLGIGIFIAAILEQSGFLNDAVYPSAIFTFGGIGLLVGFFMTKKLQE